jgi:hypothetical protein
MDTYLEALLSESKNFSWNKPQYLFLIENGILSINEKARQSHNNSLKILKHIKSDYDFLKEYIPPDNRKKNIEENPFPTPTVIMFRGIATWGTEDHMLWHLEKYGLDFGISFQDFPRLSRESLSSIKHDIKSNSKNYNQRIVNNVVSWFEKGEFENIYQFIYPNKPQESDGTKACVRGLVSELILKYILVDSTRKSTDKPNIIVDIGEFRHSLKVNGSAAQNFGFEYQADLLMHHNEESVLKQTLYDLNSRKSINGNNFAKVEFNKHSEPLTIHGFERPKITMYQP